MRTMLLALLSAWALRAQALEVSLEENKAQRGNIGYVDMQKLFRLYPETQKAKQNFEEVLRQAEDQVNLRKAELIELRAEIINLRMERDAAARLAAGIQAAPAPAAPQAGQFSAIPAAVAATTATVAGVAAAVEVSTSAVAVSTPGAAPSIPEAVAVDTATAALASLLVSSPTVQASSATAPAAAPTQAGLPGTPSMADTAGLAPRQAGLPGTPSMADTAGLAPRQAAAEEETGAPLIINLPGLSPEPIVVQPPAAALQAAANLPELENKLAEKSKALRDKEAEFKRYQAQVEKNLLELEEKKTEILLGKIYHAVQEVAREEGISVVVDRSQILFGHQAMDLTDKVVKKLKGT